MTSMTSMTAGHRAHFGIEALLLLFFAVAPMAVHAQDPRQFASCTIVARDPLTGDIGVGVWSPHLAAGSIVPWAAASAGGLATQGRANASVGRDGLRMLGYGWTASQALDSLLATDPDRETRQLAMVDRMGGAVGYTGTACIAWAGHRSGAGYVVAGAGIGASTIVDSMASAFERSSGDLAERLVVALAAAEVPQAVTGRSAAVIVVRDGAGHDGADDRMVDLRVDGAMQPVKELRRLYGEWVATAGVANRLAAIDRFNANRMFAAAQEETQRLVNALNAQIREKPDDPETLNSVAWALSTSGIAKDRALELSTRAVKLAPGDVRYMDTLAECNFRLGKKDEAVRLASEIVAKQPSNEYYRARLQSFLEGQPR